MRIRPGDLVAAAGERLELGQQRVVDEVEQRVAGDALVVGGPVGPAQMLRERRLVVVAEQFELLLAVVEDLQEEHPAELFEALGVAVGAGVLAHDVLDGFDEIGDVGHRSGGFLVERDFEFPDGGEVVCLAAEEIDDFDWRAERSEWIDFQDFERLDAPDAAVGILVEQRVEHGARLLAVLGEDVALLDTARRARGE